MNKRVAAAALWFYAAWYLWATIARLSGLADWLGPLVGALAAILVVRVLDHTTWGSGPDRSNSERVRD